MPSQNCTLRTHLALRLGLRRVRARARVPAASRSAPPTPSMCCCAVLCCAVLCCAAVLYCGTDSTAERRRPSGGFSFGSGSVSRSRASASGAGAGFSFAVADTTKYVMLCCAVLRCAVCCTVFDGTDSTFGVRLNGADPRPSPSVLASQRALAVVLAFPSPLRLLLRPPPPPLPQRRVSPLRPLRRRCHRPKSRPKHAKSRKRVTPN